MQCVMNNNCLLTNCTPSEPRGPAGGGNPAVRTRLLRARVLSAPGARSQALQLHDAGVTSQGQKSVCQCVPTFYQNRITRNFRVSGPRYVTSHPITTHSILCMVALLCFILPTRVAQ